MSFMYLQLSNAYPALDLARLALAGWSLAINRKYSKSLENSWSRKFPDWATNVGLAAAWIAGCCMGPSKCKESKVCQSLTRSWHRTTSIWYHWMNHRIKIGSKDYANRLIHRRCVITSVDCHWNFRIKNGMPGGYWQPRRPCRWHLCTIAGSIDMHNEESSATLLLKQDKTKTSQTWAPWNVWASLMS